MNVRLQGLLYQGMLMQNIFHALFVKLYLVVTTWLTFGCYAIICFFQFHNFFFPHLAELLRNILLTWLYI